METPNKIQMLTDGRFVSQHKGAIVYHDNKHKIFKAQMSDGGFMELLEEEQPDGSFTYQMISSVNASGEQTIIKYDAVTRKSV